MKPTAYLLVLKLVSSRSPHHKYSCPLGLQIPPNPLTVAFPLALEVYSISISCNNLNFASFRSTAFGMSTWLDCRRGGAGLWWSWSVAV